MADVSMGGRGFAPQAGSYQAYQSYQPAPQIAPEPNLERGEGQGGPSNSVHTATALTGAALSLALVVGVGLWGYQLMARDVAGVPVVRAQQGEMRVRPEESGGTQAQNQGFSVNEVAAEGGTAGPSERIILAPEPIDLSQEDTPLIDQLVAAQPRYAAPDAGAEQSAVTGAVPTLTSAPAQSQEETRTDNPQMAEIEALAAQIAAGATPLTARGEVSTPPVQLALRDPSPTNAGGSTLTDAQTTASTAVDESAPTNAVPVPSIAAIARDVPGVAISKRPLVRPADLRLASASAQVPAAPRTQDVEARSIPKGTRLVQLGAYESAEVARQEWDRFSSRFSEFMAGKDRVIQKASSGGRTFYRLRAMGFADLSDARRFCAALTARNTDCIPVVTR